MIQLTKKQRGAFLSGEVNTKDLAQEFLQSYPITEIAESLAELLTAPTAYAEPKPIVLSDEDYNRLMGMFRQRGVALDGSPITRGRKKKGEGQVKCN